MTSRSGRAPRKPSPARAAVKPGGARPFTTRPGEPVFLLESSTVEDFWAVRRRVQPLIKSSRNPVMVKDRDWEGSGPYLYGTVLYDPEDKLFKCWYTVFHDKIYRAGLGGYLVCYATSEDGYTWVKPELGLFEFRGSKKNNYLGLAPRDAEAISVVAPPPEAGVPYRYVALYLEDSPTGTRLAYSNDGKKWKQHKQNPVGPYSDAHNSLLYDPVRRRWLIHQRPGVFAGWTQRRIAMMESKDLQTWTQPEIVLIPDEADVPEFYGMPVFQRGNLFFGLLQVYERPTGRIEIELVFSADGRRWERVPPRELFLSRGSPGEFDCGMVLTANAPVIAHDEMRFYYGGSRLNHEEPAPPDDAPWMAIGMASVPLDRIFGVTASQQEPGYILTRPMVLKGNTIEVNAAVRGQLKVALLDPDRMNYDEKELPGYEFEKCQPIKGDDLRHRVSWPGQERLPRDPVRLKLQLEDSTFYALYVR